jgi:hypothetical protein
METKDKLSRYSFDLFNWYSFEIDTVKRLRANIVKVDCCLTRLAVVTRTFGGLDS